MHLDTIDWLILVVGLIAISGFGYWAYFAAMQPDEFMHKLRSRGGGGVGLSEQAMRRWAIARFAVAAVVYVIIAVWLTLT